MKLEEKGKIIPPPVLDKYPQMVSTEIQQWKNIISATHWHFSDNTKVDGADFYVAEQELGHIHLDGSVHLAAGEELKKLFLSNNLAKKFQYGENWVEFKISSEKDVQKAILLFQLNYERINGISLDDLITKLASVITKNN